MTDLRAALRTAVAAPPPDEIDLVTVMSSGRRARARRRRWLVAGIATATATVTVAGVVVVSLVVGDQDSSDPDPAVPPRPDTTQRAIDPQGPARDFVRDPVRGFEADAPLLRDGDVVLGGPDDDLTSAYLTEDLQVLVSRWDAGPGDRYGLVDPASPTEVDWLPDYPGAAEVYPFCEFWAGDGRGDCLQGARMLSFYYFVSPQSRRIELLQFDRVTREWSDAARPPRTTTGTPSVDARIVDNKRLVIDGPAGRKIVRLDQEPFCDRQDGLVPRHETDTGVGIVSAEGDFVTLEYYCASLTDPGGGGDNAFAVLDADGEMLVDLQPYDGGAAMVADRYLSYRGMFVDLAGGRAYRLLRDEPRALAQGWKSAYAGVMSVRGGFVTWIETHLTAEDAADGGPESGDGILHLTPLSGG